MNKSIKEQLESYEEIVQLENEKTIYINEMGIEMPYDGHKLNWITKEQAVKEYPVKLNITEVSKGNPVNYDEPNTEIY